MREKKKKKEEKKCTITEKKKEGRERESIRRRKSKRRGSRGKKKKTKAPSTTPKENGTLALQVEKSMPLINRALLRCSVSLWRHAYHTFKKQQREANEEFDIEIVAATLLNVYVCLFVL